MRLEKRIRALESKLTTAVVILHFADGSTQQLRGSSDFLLRLLLGVCGGADLGSGQAAQLDLIRRAVGAQEPGGGHLVEMMQALLNGPAEETADCPAT
jgi:hypothetical protein